MRIEGPARYQLTFKPDRVSVRDAQGDSKFSGIATLKQPKLYVISVANKPCYVGVTKQPVRNHLRLGSKAKADSKHHSYAIRSEGSPVDIDVWCHLDAVDRSDADLEAVEAELVFLIRRAGQWPKHQSVIHSRPSTWRHRKMAADIMAHYSA
jgi:hypothetical protein